MSGSSMLDAHDDVIGWNGPVHTSEVEERALRVAFDIGGVLSKYPEVFRPLIVRLLQSGVEVFVITDMKDRDGIIETLRLNAFDMIPNDHVYSADYDVHGEACKAVLLRDLKIDVFFDDFVGYVAPHGSPVRCLVMPDETRPYYHDEWKIVGSSWDGGRCRYSCDKKI